MGTAFFVVQANAEPGQDAELNRWYEEQHLDDCLACDTAISAQRFHKVPGSGPGNYEYMALYEIGDPRRFADNQRIKQGTPLLPRSPALALPAHAFFYRTLPGQPALLARPERTAFYIEFLDLAPSEGAGDKLIARQTALAAQPGLCASELMRVDVYQERQGWHADAIIFAEIAGEATGRLRAPSPTEAGTALTVVEAGLYVAISPRRVAPQSR